MLFQVLDILYFLATPFVNLGLGVLHLALWPLRLLARFEVCPFYTEPINLYTIDIEHFLKDLLIYLALAILTGVISGLIFIVLARSSWTIYLVASRGCYPPRLRYYEIGPKRNILSQKMSQGIESLWLYFTGILHHPVITMRDGVVERMPDRCLRQS